MEKANALLNKYFYVFGTVLRGNQSGRKIGFPTINLLLNDQEQTVPKMGCYVTLVKVSQKYYYGLTCLIIKRPPLILCETYLENFNREIYGLKVKIFFLRFYRNNEPFISWKQMQKLITADLKELQDKPKIDHKMLL